MADNEKQQLCEGHIHQIKAIPRDQLFKGRTRNMLEDIIKQFEDKYLTVTEGSHDT